MRVLNNHFEDLSIDIETAAQPSNSPNERKLVLILSISAIFFNPNSESTFEELIEGDRMFYSPVSLTNSLARGFECDADTLEFWRKTSTKNPRVNAVADAASSVEDVRDTFIRLNEFLRNDGKAPRRIWAKSPSFDCSLLREAFNHVGLTLNLRVFDERDIRVMLDVTDNPVPEPEGMDKHNPVHDAAHEAMAVQEFNLEKRNRLERLAKLDFLEKHYTEGDLASLYGEPVLENGVWTFKDPSKSKATLAKKRMK